MFGLPRGPANADPGGQLSFEVRGEGTLNLVISLLCVPSKNIKELQTEGEQFMNTRPLLSCWSEDSACCSA